MVSDLNAEGFIGGIRLDWVVQLMLIHDEVGLSEAVSTASLYELGYVNLCLESVFTFYLFFFNSLLIAYS